MIPVSVRIAPKDFCGIPELLALIQDTFRYMRGKIDPPSSAERLTVDTLAAKVRDEHLFLAEIEGLLAGCAFAEFRGEHLYLSKIAVAGAFQGKGIGKAMLHAAIALAQSASVRELRLETRIELTRNHRMFEAWGFEAAGRTAHPGFSNPTSITYRLTI